MFLNSTLFEFLNSKVQDGAGDVTSGDRSVGIMFSERKQNQQGERGRGADAVSIEKERKEENT